MKIKYRMISPHVRMYDRPNILFWFVYFRKRKRDKEGVGERKREKSRYELGTSISVNYSSENINTLYHFDVITSN